jgi:hypothetical protein
MACRCNCVLDVGGPAIATELPADAPLLTETDLDGTRVLANLPADKLLIA